MAHKWKASLWTARQYFDFMAEIQTTNTEACSTGKESTRVDIIERQTATHKALWK